MSKHTDDLKAKWEKAEADAQKLMADKDDAVAKVFARYADRLQKANQRAADAQKEWNDAVAAQGLVGRDDAEDVADRLGLTLPSDG